jgi:Uma2 family endonuclease
MAVATHKWTIDRYHLAVNAGVFEDQSVELLKGDLVEMPSEGIPHAGVSSNGADYLRAMLGAQVKIREARPVTLPNDSEPQPDIAIVKPLGNIYATQRHPNVNDIFWVMEYSFTSLDKDLGLKSEIYAEAGIPEYWVVNLNPAVRELTVFRDPVNGDYLLKTKLIGGTIRSLAFPQVPLDVIQLVS